MNRKEDLKKGKMIADRWWYDNKSTILSKQLINKQKAWIQIKKCLRRQAMSHIQNISKEILAYE